MPRPNRGPSLKFREDRGAWEIVWFERGRRRSKSTGTGDRREAEKAFGQFLLGQEQPGPRDPSERKIADVLNDYAEEHGPHVASPRQISYCVKALIPFWGARVVADIREGTCRAYVAYRGRKAGTVRHELAILQAAVRYDWKAGRLTAEVPVWKPPAPDGKDRWLNRQEAAALLRAARGAYRAKHHLPLFILIGLYTGARSEAILSLRWAQVDLNRRLIDFNPPGRERTSKGRPILPVPRRLLRFLSYAKKRGTDTGFVVTRFGKPVKDVSESFSNACTTAGLSGVTPHTLRHTAASWMAQAGVPFPVIARYLGHSDSRTTERIYAHHSADYLQAAVRAFD